MPWAECRFIKRVAEFVPKQNIKFIPANTRGIYALMKEETESSFSVVYIGLSAGERAGAQSRMKAHRRHKGVQWTHFSIFEVHDNISNDEIKELEGLFRHIYRKDETANKLNKLRRYKKFKRITNDIQSWE